MLILERYNNTFEKPKQIYKFLIITVLFVRGKKCICEIFIRQLHKNPGTQSVLGCFHTLLSCQNLDLSYNFKVSNLMSH